MCNNFKIDFLQWILLHIIKLSLIHCCFKKEQGPSSNDLFCNSSDNNFLCKSHRAQGQQGPLHSVPKNLRSSCDQRDLQDSFLLYVALFCYVPSRKYSKDISHFYDPLCGKYWIVEKLSSLSFNLSLVSYKQNKIN